MPSLIDILLIAGFLYFSGGVITAIQMMPHERMRPTLVLLWAWIIIAWLFVLITFGLVRLHERFR